MSGLAAPAHDPPRVVHLIPNLNLGGAERTLLRLLESPIRQHVVPHVVLFRREGPLLDHVRELGIPIVSVFDDGVTLRGISHLRSIASDGVDLIQSWTYPSDFASVVVPRGVRIVWNLRMSSTPRGTISTRNKWVRLANAVLSYRVPDAIVCCGRSAKEYHRRLGFSASNMSIIPNGIAVEKTFSCENKSAAKAVLDIPETATVVLRLARLHPAKDYESTLRIIRLVAEASRDIKFVLCGPRVPDLREKLSADYREHVQFLSGREHVQQLFEAADIVLSNSLSEGFPNTVLEGMAKGAVPVATPVGDTEEIVGGAGFLIPVRDPRSASDAILKIHRLADSDRRTHARAAITQADKFSLDRMVRAYDSLYAHVATQRTAKRDH